MLGLEVIVVCLLFGALTHGQSTECIALNERNDCAVDVYFTIDTSETIALQESPPGALVESIKTFAEQFAERLEDAELKGVVRLNWNIGGLHFSQDQREFSTIGPKSNFITGVKGIRYLGKGTHIDCALTNMTEKMLRYPSTTSPGLVRFAVVITDGHVTGNPCGGIKMAAERAREKEIHMFVVAASKNIEETGLREIANSPASVYRREFMAVDLSQGRATIHTDTIERIINTMCYNVTCLETPGPDGPTGPRGQKGAKGDNGDPGPKGLKGRPGDPGIEGPIGQPGSKGQPGVLGDKGVAGVGGRNGTDGQKGKLGRIGAPGCKGDPGDRGPDGHPGDVGERGFAGTNGEKGDAGRPGRPGPSGLTGEAGPKGERGSPGSPGVPGLKGNPDSEENRGEEETMDQRVLKGQMELRETRETMACQAPGDHRGQQERLGKMAPEVTLVMLDQEVILDRLDQRETLEDLASAILGQEDHRVREERRAIVDLAAAEETVVQRGEPGSQGEPGLRGPRGELGRDGDPGPEGDPGLTECDVMNYIRETCGCCDCEKQCGALDIVFVIDSSESVGLTNFTLEKNFVINTINRLGSFAKDPNSETGTRVGVVQYSHSGTFQAIQLNDPKIDSLTAFKDAVKRLEWIAGGTWTPSALKYAYDNLIRDSRRAKANVTVVVITDGRFDPRDDDTLLKYLCSDGYNVDVSAIGIGDMFDQIEENESLKSIACQKDGRVLGMKRFADLVAEEFINKIETVLCPEPVIKCPDLPCKSGGGVTAGQAPSPWKPLAEESSPSLVPTSLEGVTSLLNNLSEQQYGVGIATMAYTAQRAKLAHGADRQQWTQLFINSFKYVYGDIMGDPEKALGLC
ncbi:hypothetical protein FQN60_016319 [Etheostoma spectabile]|uniref:VWFA domain-containing protein n=1 Tax=Etheostoma spectabile TaxID=54343 RepID=A0A5J5D0L4_9PERO|nr:hypothetical protein FQN60_016319 [Etheostoma spectabile]